MSVEMDMEIDMDRSIRQIEPGINNQRVIKESWHIIRGRRTRSQEDAEVLVQHNGRSSPHS